jgi:acyl carrier protein
LAERLVEKTIAIKMERIRFKLYKILRNIGIPRKQIKLLSLFNQELKLDGFDQLCYLNYLENRFHIQIPDKDIPDLKTIEATVEYLQHKIYGFIK